MSDDTSPECSQRTSDKRKPIGVITISKKYWLVTPNWYTKDNIKVDDAPKSLISSMWTIWTKAQCPAVEEFIYDKTELLRWIIKGNPHK